jgi:hypothetical protein
MLTGLEILATGIPFLKGLRVCLRCWSATRRVDAGSLRRAGSSPPGGETEPLARLMMLILRKSLKDDEVEHPPDFVYDATRQYVMNEYETNYTRLITMFGSLLPPVGFVGTTCAMLMRFLSMAASGSTIEFGALALALTSTVFALSGFSILEGLKILLYRRLLVALRDVQVLFDEAEQRRETKRSAA